MRDPLLVDGTKDPIEELRRLARAYGERTVREDAEFIAEQFETQAVSIAVLGQFKRGKSTLLNALLGCDLLPTGRLPVTGIVTRLRYSQRPVASVRYVDGRDNTIDVSGIGLYVTEEHNPGNRLGVQRVDVEFPCDLLRNAILVDTPGIGSTLVHNTQAAHEVIGRIDLALFVTGPEPPITQEEVEFLRKVREFADRVLVVIAKIDRAGDGAQEIIGFTRRMVAQVLPPDAQVFSVDSLHADERVVALRAVVANIVNEEGEHVLRRGRDRRVARVAAAIRQSLDLRRAALLLPRQERERARARFADLVVEVQERADDLVHAIDRFPNEELAAVDDSLQHLYDAARQTVGQEMPALADKRPDEAERELYARIAEIEREWSDSVYLQVREHIDAREESIVRRTTELERQFLHAGCEALGLQQAPSTSDIAFGKRQAVSRMSGPMPTTGLEIVAGGLVMALPAPLRAQALRKRFIRLAPDLLDRARGRVRSAVLEYLTNWRYAYRVEVAQCLAEARLVVEDAFAQASQPQTDDATRAKVEGLETDFSRLERALSLLAPTSAGA